MAGLQRNGWRLIIVEKPAIALAQQRQAIDYAGLGQKWREMWLKLGGNLVQLRLAERPRKRYMKLEGAQHVGVAELFHERFLLGGKLAIGRDAASAAGRAKGIEAGYAFGGEPIDIRRAPREHKAEEALEERRHECAAAGSPPHAAEGIEGASQVFFAGVLAERERRLQGRVQAVAGRSLYRAGRKLRAKPRNRRPGLANHRAPKAARSRSGCGVQ